MCHLNDGEENLTRERSILSHTVYEGVGPFENLWLLLLDREEQKAQAEEARPGVGSGLPKTRTSLRVCLWVVIIPQATLTSSSNTTDVDCYNYYIP